MSVLSSSHVLASNGARHTPAKNVRLIIEVRHGLSVHSALTSALFDGSIDALCAISDVSTVTTGVLPGSDGGRKRPLIRQIARKVARKVIPKIRRRGIRGLLGRRMAALLENLEEIPEEPRAPERLEELNTQAVSSVVELDPNDTSASGIVGTLKATMPSGSPASEISTHI